LIPAFVVLSPRAARAERLPIRVYTIADGLPHDRINRIMRDSHGFLWFCTPGGLGRFDGERFVSYHEDDGLPSESVNDILEDGAVYWVATNGGGVARFDPNAAAGLSLGTDVTLDARPRTFAVFRVGDRAATNRVNVLFRDSTSRIWAATDGGLFVFQRESHGGHFRRVSLDNPGYADDAVQVWSVQQDREGVLWIGTSRGLVRRLPDGSMVWYAIRPAAGVDHVWTVLLSRNGRMLIGHSAGLLAIDRAHARVAPTIARVQRRIDDLGATRWFTAPQGAAAARVRALYETGDGRVWVGSDANVGDFDGTRLRLFSGTQALDTVVDAFAEDTAGNLWVGTAIGAARLARGGFTTYDHADGLSDFQAPLIFETRAGELCAVSARLFVNVFDGRRFNAVRPQLPPSPAAGTFPAVLQDHAGEWWIGNGEDLYRFPAAPSAGQLSRLRWKTRYSRRDGLAGGVISRLFEDSRGDVWIATRVPSREVVTRWERRTGTFHRYGSEHGLPAFDPADWFVEDGSGSVWIGFWNGSGVARYRGSGFTWIPSPARAWGGTSLLLDRRGRLWIGGLGLWRVDDPSADRPTLVPYTARNFTPRGVVLLAEDRRGRLYFRSSEGLIRLDAEAGTIDRYTTADGLASMEAKAGYLARDGALWFAVARGVSRLFPDHPDTRQPVPVAIGRIRVAGTFHSPGELGAAEVRGLVLQPGERQFQIDYFAISFEGGQVVRYQYRLDGVDAEWSVPARERSVTFGYLAPGGYRFLVRAVDSRGVVSTRPAVVEFAVLAPLWRRPWFAGTGAALLLIGVFAGHRYHVRRLLEVERVRTRIAADLHDDIGSSLSQIAILSEVAQQRGAAALPPIVADALMNIAVTSREVVDSMGEIVWAINPRRDRLSDLTQRMRRFASDMLPARGIEFTFEAPHAQEDQRLGADMRRHVFLIFKESVTNIARHSGATRASIALGIDRAALRLTIADDGRGRTTSADTDDGSSHGHGLSGMRARATDLGGTLRIDALATGGLLVALTVPLHRRRKPAAGASEPRNTPPPV
jgi:signal transduction histidine kinase/ligand-binding sensor domain-containing protein